MRTDGQGTEAFRPPAWGGSEVALAGDNSDAEKGEELGARKAVRVELNCVDADESTVPLEAWRAESRDNANLGRRTRFATTLGPGLNGSREPPRPQRGPALGHVEGKVADGGTENSLPKVSRDRRRSCEAEEEEEKGRFRFDQESSP